MPICFCNISILTLNDIDFMISPSSKSQINPQLNNVVPLWEVKISRNSKNNCNRSAKSHDLDGIAIINKHKEINYAQFRAGITL